MTKVDLWENKVLAAYREALKNLDRVLKNQHPNVCYAVRQRLDCMPPTSTLQERVIAINTLISNFEKPVKKEGEK